jgi:hypothetical protein
MENLKALTLQPLVTSWFISSVRSPFRDMDTPRHEHTECLLRQVQIWIYCWVITNRLSSVFGCVALRSRALGISERPLLLFWIHLIQPHSSEVPRVRV